MAGGARGPTRRGPYASARAYGPRRVGGSAMVRGVTDLCRRPRGRGGRTGSRGGGGPGGVPGERAPGAQLGYLLWGLGPPDDNGPGGCAARYGPYAAVPI